MTNSADQPQLTDPQREARARRLAHSQGFAVVKSRTRDEAAPSFGGYMIRDLNRNTIGAGDRPFPFSLTLDDLERWLRGLDLIDEPTDPDDLLDRD